MESLVWLIEYCFPSNISTGPGGLFFLGEIGRPPAPGSRTSRTPPGKTRGGHPWLAPRLHNGARPRARPLQEGHFPFPAQMLSARSSASLPTCGARPRGSGSAGRKWNPGGPATDDVQRRGAEGVPPCLDFPPFPQWRESSAHTHPFTTKKGSSMDMAPGSAVRALPEVSRGQRLGRGDSEQRCAQSRVPDYRRCSTRSAPWAESHSKPAPTTASSPSTSGA